jgi:hypothetical protein
MQTQYRSELIMYNSQVKYSALNVKYNTKYIVRYTEDAQLGIHISAKTYPAQTIETQLRHFLFAVHQNLIQARTT